MLLLTALISLAEAGPAAFPERVPGMIEACLLEAVETGEVSDTDDSHKYLCSGEAAEQLWSFLENARLESHEQDVPEGRWLGRDFPLGGCFKRVRMPDGSTATTGLSCSIWIPRPLK